MARSAYLALTISLLLVGQSLHAEEDIHRTSMTDLPDIGKPATSTMVEIVKLYEELAGTTLRKMWVEDSEAADPAAWDTAIDTVFVAVRDLHGRALVQYRTHLKEKGKLDGWDHKFPKAWEQWFDDHKEFFRAVQWQGSLQIEQKWRMNDRTTSMRKDMKRDVRRIDRFHETCIAVDKHLVEAFDAAKSSDAGDASKTLRTHENKLRLEIGLLRNWTDIASEMDERLTDLFKGTTREGYVMKEFHQGFITLRERVDAFNRVDPVFHEELEIWEDEGKKHLDAYVKMMGDYGAATREYRQEAVLKNLTHLRGGTEGLVPSAQFVLERVIKAQE